MTFDEMFPLKTVINLDRRPDRLANCREEFKKIGINPIRKSGVLFEGGGNTYTNGVVGCLASHYQILQSAMLLGCNTAIFEDDVHFQDDKYNIPEILQCVCDELDTVKWDMVYLGANILKPFYRVTDHLARLGHAQSTVAYLINRNFTEKLLSYIDIANIKAPIDVIYAESVVPENNCFVTIPMIVIQKSNFSDIEGRQVTYEDYLEKRYFENYKETKNENS
jgi:GR25 family glycosyltransferase involved in LPS biosynthesis